MSIDLNTSNELMTKIAIH